MHSRGAAPTSISPTHLPHYAADHHPHQTITSTFSVRVVASGPKRGQ